MAPQTIDNSISRTDQVLVLLNRLAVAGNDVAQQASSHQQQPSGVRSANQQQQAKHNAEQQASALKSPAAGHRRGSQTMHSTSASSQHEPGAALQIVLGDAQDSSPRMLR